MRETLDFAKTIEKHGYQALWIPEGPGRDPFAHSAYLLSHRYCYSSRIMYVDKELWHGMWVDLYDANHKLWKAISYYNDFHNHPPLGRTIDGVASVAYDLQKTHMTVWCGYANAVIGPELRNQ